MTIAQAPGTMGNTPGGGSSPVQSRSQAGRATGPAPRGLLAALRSARPRVLSAWWRTQFDRDRIARYGIVGAAGQSPEAMVTQFLGPLYDLLVEYIRTRQPAFADVYLDERLRYAPHQAAPTVRAAYFNEILGDDEAAIVADPHVQPWSDSLRNLLAELHTPLRQAAGGVPLRMLGVGDCLMSEVRLTLARQCADGGVSLDLRLLYFSALMGQALSVDNILASLAPDPPDLIALSFLSYEGIPPYPALLRDADRTPDGTLATRVAAIVAIIHAAVDRVRAATDAPILLHNASGLPLTRYRRTLPLVPPLSAGRRRALGALNTALAELAERTPNVILVDEWSVARQHGLRDCASPYLPGRTDFGGLFHTARFGSYLTPLYADIVSSYRTLHNAKVLLVDFDHTLWDGVMADGSVAHRRDLQLLLKRLREAGILLVAVSKNDPANIRWEEMVLQPDDFVLHKIGWGLKVSSIREAAAQLDLGLNACVLLDDNPAERELVRSHLPTVHTLDPNASNAKSWLERMFQFPITRETGEARMRTAMYREQAARREALAIDADYPSMMAALELEACTRAATTKDLERIAELVQRTNQFNTTTIRYTREQLQRFLSSPSHGVYVASLADKFGSVGLVVATIVERRDPGIRVLDSFVMSCRAMGFGLERFVLASVIDAEERGAGKRLRIEGRFTPTDRNGPAAHFYDESGFAASAAEGGTLVLDPADPRPERPAWIRLAPG